MPPVLILLLLVVPGVVSSDTPVSSGLPTTSAVGCLYGNCLGVSRGCGDLHSAFYNLSPPIGRRSGERLQYTFLPTPVFDLVCLATTGGNCGFVEGVVVEVCAGGSTNFFGNCLGGSCGCGDLHSAFYNLTFPIGRRSGERLQYTFLPTPVFDLVCLATTGANCGFVEGVVVEVRAVR